jgi:hypothetical protein
MIWVHFSLSMEREEHSCWRVEHQLLIMVVVCVVVVFCVVACVRYFTHFVE